MYSLARESPHDGHRCTSTAACIAPSLQQASCIAGCRACHDKYKGGIIKNIGGFPKFTNNI